MATRDDVQLALRVIEEFNRQTQELRNDANSVIMLNQRLDECFDNPEQRAKLVSGLQGLNMEITQLSSDKEAMQVVAQYILDNVPELTFFAPLV